jgi:hypothetical protein
MLFRQLYQHSIVQYKAHELYKLWILLTVHDAEQITLRHMYIRLDPSQQNG